MRRVVFLTLTILIFLTFFTTVEVVEGKFILFVTDGVSLSELDQVETINLDRLINMGAVGLMNTKTAGNLDSKDSYLTLGAGDRARADEAAALNFNLKESYNHIRAEDIYQRRIGELAVDAQIVNIELAKLIAFNKRSNYQAEVGKLGDSLKEEGFKVAVLGNADTFKEPSREIAMLGIDKYGVITKGDVSQRMSIKSDRHPSGYITNQEYLLTQFESLLEATDLIVIESGDTARVEKVDYLLTTKKFEIEKRKAIKRVDFLLGEIMNRVDLSEDYLLFVVPTSSNKGIRRGDKLTLTVVAGPRVDGLLTSGTTRRTGLITNLDIAPTIYNYLGGENTFFTGRKIDSIFSNYGIDYLQGLNKKIITTFKWRPTLVKGFILIQIIILIVIGIILIYKDISYYLIEIIKYILLALLWIPIFFLLSRFFIIYDIILVTLFWVGTSLFLAYLTLRSKDNLIPILIPSLLTFILLAIDIWTGNRLIELSILGYSPVIGARFYGIGNEFMGIIIGAGVVGVTVLKEYDRRWTINKLLVLFIILVVTIGHPKLGANFGGLITAAVICTITYFNLKGARFDYNYLLKIIFILFFSIILVILFDLVGTEDEQTHFAHTLLSIKEGGLSQLLKIIYRKVSINLKLLRWTIWSKVLIAFVAILVILFKRPKGRLKVIMEEYPSLTAGFRGLILGSVVTMFVNDSGVVAAATLLIFPIFSLLYLILSGQSAMNYEQNH